MLVTTLISPERLMSLKPIVELFPKPLCYNPHQPRKADVTSRQLVAIVQGKQQVTTLISPERLMSQYRKQLESIASDVTTLISPERLMSRSAVESERVNVIASDVTTLISPERLMSLHQVGYSRS